MKRWSNRSRTAAAALTGVALLALHAAALPFLVEAFDRDAMRVRLGGDIGLVARGDRLDVAAELPHGLVDRVQLSVDGVPLAPDARPSDIALAPGLHRVEWRARYRGGSVRRVGWTQLVGPLQDPARPPCSVRLLVGQPLLDDGAAGPGTLAAEVARQATRELSGLSIWGLGGFERVRRVRLAWAGREAWRGAHLRAVLDIDLTGGSLELTVRLTPHIVGGELTVAADTDARVHLNNRIAQWVVDLVKGNRVVARLAHREIAGVLDSLLASPPPLDLGGGRTLELTFCDDRDIEIVDGAYAAVWLAVRIDASAAAGAGRPPAPPLLPAEPPTATAPVRTPLALELDGNALNAALFHVWAIGLLDEELAASDLVSRVNGDPVVADLLSVRARGPHLPLPPTIAASASGGYDLRMASALWLDDGALHTPAHLFGRAGLALQPGEDVGVAVSLAELGLTCEPEPRLLEPCYPELAAELARRAPDLHADLSAWFSDLVKSWLVGRALGTPEAGGVFHIERSVLVPPPTGRHGPLRIELHGRFAVD